MRLMRCRWAHVCAAGLLIALLPGFMTSAQGIRPAPDRGEDEGLGPFDRLVIQGVILIDGTGAPPRGPVNIVIEGNRIESISSGSRLPRDVDHILDAGGMEVAPQHYAFLIDEEDFDRVFARIRARGLAHWADPFKRRPGEINRNDGGRGVYFDAPDGHLLEVLTRRYGSGG